MLDNNFNSALFWLNILFCCDTGSYSDLLHHNINHVLWSREKRKRNFERQAGRTSAKETLRTCMLVRPRVSAVWLLSFRVIATRKRQTVLSAREQRFRTTPEKFTGLGVSPWHRATTFVARKYVKKKNIKHLLHAIDNELVHRISITNRSYQTVTIRIHIE